MDRREDGAPGDGQIDGSYAPDPSANFKMLLIAAAFLMVTIGLVLLQPGQEPDVDVADPIAPLLSDPAPDATEVTRADASLLDLDGLSASEAVSRQLRQPIRLTETGVKHRDLRTLTADVLQGFGHTVHDGDPLHALLVQALTEGQSNAYIDALLNTALARGDFKLPTQLRLTSGRLNTPALLAALVRQSRS
ncbi:hypothetical protein [uncultured Tateyamaria sp.]|uniref:hypothetical protein n=1 Tax=uncultured Tateyamaria sp. TaxID=455651 RepID=UPI002639A3FB|nr:hypothetical protein [uncultured Tateyamaria sp.]